MNDIQDKIIGNFLQMVNFSVTTAIQANNDHIRPHRRAKLLNHNWRLKLVLILSYFLETYYGKIPIGKNLRNSGKEINRDYSFGSSNLETIDHLSRQCFYKGSLVYKNRLLVSKRFLDWIVWIQNYGNVCNKLYYLPL